MSSDTRFSGILERGDVGFSSSKMSWAHWLAAGLAAITGAIHVYLYVMEGFVAFLFAGVVFFAAIVALLLDVYRRLLYVLGVPFTGGQFVMWVAIGMPNMDVALVDKPVQVVLIVVLVYVFANEDALVARR